MLAGFLAVIVSEAAAQLIFRIYTSEWRLLAFEKLMPWFNIDPWEPMPLFFFSGAGTAIIVICLSVIFTEKFRNARWLSSLVAVGQSTLTLYVAHIPVGIIIIWVMEFFKFEYPLFPIWGTFLFFMSSIVFCYKWNKRFKKGPLELLMRRFLVSQKKVLVFSQP